MFPVSTSSSSRRATICSEVKPSGNSELMRHDAALDDGRDHIAQAGMRLELIFAGLEIFARLERQHAANKDPGLIDDALAHQHVGNVADAGAARDIDDAILGQRAGSVKTLLAKHQRGASYDRRQDEQSDDGVADDNKRMPRPFGAAAVVGISTVSGSSAVRGLRGVRCLLSFDASAPLVSPLRQRRIRLAGARYGSSGNSGQPPGAGIGGGHGRPRGRSGGRRTSAPIRRTRRRRLGGFVAALARLAAELARRRSGWPELAAFVAAEPSAASPLAWPVWWRPAAVLSPPPPGTAATGLSAGRAGAARGVTAARPLPLGGGARSVTAAYPFRY